MLMPNVRALLVDSYGNPGFYSQYYCTMGFRKCSGFILASLTLANGDTTFPLRRPKLLNGYERKQPTQLSF